MSDLLLAAGLEADLIRAAKRLAWTPRTRTWSGKCGRMGWAVSRVDDPHLWAPAYDPHSKLRLLIGGRLAFDPDEWDCAEHLPYEGGLAARLVLERWLEEGKAATDRLNGAALVVLIDERRQETQIWTDRMGRFPAFVSSTLGICVSSHPDEIARLLGFRHRPSAVDLVTVAEFLHTGTATHPHTYWSGIEHLEPGSHYSFDFDGRHWRNNGRYWRPRYFEDPPIADRAELIDRLAGTLRSAIRRRSHARLGRVAVMLSAGADSRSALFAACDPSRVTCYTLYDEPNAELEGAQRLAQAAGAHHVALPRSADYYIENAAEAVRLSGGMWSVESAHYVGVAETIAAEGPGVLLTGCYADYLFKGLAFNRRQRSLFGRHIPLYRLADYAHQFYLPFEPIREEWRAPVEARLSARFGNGWEASGDPRKIEYLRLAPLAREGDASGRLCLWRQLPVDPIMEDRDVLEVYGLMAIADKISGIAYGMAVSRLVGRAGAAVPNNNYGAPVGAGEAQRVGAFVLASLRRKIDPSRGQPFERDPASIATVGSWPHFPRLIERSERLRDWRAAMPPEQQDLLFDIIGGDCRTWSLADWARKAPTLFLRLFTVSLWLSHIRRMEA